MAEPAFLSRVLGMLATIASWLAALDGHRRWLAAGLLGLLSVAAYAPFYITPALILAFTGLVWLLDGATRWRAAAATGWWFAFGQFIGGLAWIANAFAVREGFTYGQGLIAVFALAAAMALYGVLAALIARALWSCNWRRVLALTLGWSVAEWLRGHLFTGFPWNLPASALAFSPLPLQPAAWIGAYGLSALVILLAALPAALTYPPGAAARPSLKPLFVWLGLVLLLLVGGMLRLNMHPTRFQEDLALILVQPNIDQARKWREELLLDHLRRYMDMTANALAATPAKNVAILWPETAIAYPIEAQTGMRYLLARLIDRPGYLITGAPRFKVEENGAYQAWNSLFAIDREGTIAAAYDKAHLVPFGEYVPLRPLLSRLGVERLAQSLADFSPGPGPMTLAPPGLPAFSPLICYEGIFPGAVVAPGALRPAWLVNVSNDAWFGMSIGPHQHFAAARLRAVEEGLPLARATPTGISAVIDPVGRVIKRLGLGKSGVLISPLPQALTPAPGYARWGDWAFLVLAMLILVLSFPRRLC
ncbi:MAG: apolipoprotein N-acyltransferase [Pseudomonadota bacterium]